MTNNLTICNHLEKLIGEHLNDYLNMVEGLDFTLQEISPKCVSQSFPDTDSQSTSTHFNIVPTYSENEELSVGTDICTLNVSVFISCKRNKVVNLQKMVNGYTAAFEILLWHHQNLDGLTDICDVISVDFYPAINGDLNVAGAELSLSIQYTKEYC